MFRTNTDEVKCEEIFEIAAAVAAEVWWKEIEMVIARSMLWVCQVLINYLNLSFLCNHCHHSSTFTFFICLKWGFLWYMVISFSLYSDWSSWVQAVPQNPCLLWFIFKPDSYVSKLKCKYGLKKRTYMCIKYAFYRR